LFVNLPNQDLRAKSLLELHLSQGKVFQLGCFK